MKIKKGQRWLWTNPGYEHIVQVVDDTRYDAKCIVCQKIGPSTLLVETIRMLSLNEDNRWKYLEGQDEPES